MITTAELHRAAEAQSLRFDQVEKDYVILWILLGLSQQTALAKSWFFKGGTCLRHCYFPGYRFSEDIDFSCLPDRANLDDAKSTLGEVARWVQTNSGIRMSMKQARTIPGDFQIEIPMEYARGGMRARGLPAVKVHLTFDEPLFTNSVLSSVECKYPDISKFKITAYSTNEIVAEKMRALLQQRKKWPRPRDIYDLWFIFCKSGERFRAGQLLELFSKKCKVRDIEPDLAGLISDELREWNKNPWANQMRPLMKEVPDFEEVWREWVEAFHRVFAVK